MAMLMQLAKHLILLGMENSQRGQREHKDRESCRIQYLIQYIGVWTQPYSHIHRPASRLACLPTLPVHYPLQEKQQCPAPIHIQTRHVDGASPTTSRASFLVHGISHRISPEFRRLRSKHSGRINLHERSTMQQFISLYHVHWWNGNMGFFQENARTRPSAILSLSFVHSTAHQSIRTLTTPTLGCAQPL